MACHGFLVKSNPGSFGCHQNGRRNRHHQGKSRYSAAAVAATGSIFTSLNKSIFTFYNRLLRCVCRFLRLATTASAANKKQGYNKLKKHEQWPPLRRRTDKRRTIFLDLDETLLHLTMEPPNQVNSDLMVRIKIQGVVIPMFVVKRPGVTVFLDRLSKNYRVEVFTPGLSKDAS